MSYSKRVIILAGPTAVGKTAMAISIAKRFDCPIISADSRQCFRELSIGVARPSLEELNQVKHYFIASHSIYDSVTAADFEEYALGIVQNVFEEKDTIVMTGGTGLYIKAFCEGLDEIPAIPSQVREAIQVQYNEKGIGWLQEQLQQKDPEFFYKGEIQNPQRMMRALEVAEATGRSILSFRKKETAARNFAIEKFALELPREELYQRINNRVDQMMNDGLLEEARALLPYRHLNALQTVGYAELFDYFDGNTTLEEAISKIKQNTRRYAKRQMTWFRKNGFVWTNEKSGIVDSL